MTNTEFRQRIRKSLANENLQAALDANAERRVKGRVNAWESLPNWRERRQQAHAIRADVIEHLDEYLDKFVDKATQNGIIVHRVKDASEAIKTILEIAKDSPQRTPSPQSEESEAKESLAPLSDTSTSLSTSPRGKKILVAKSKSMVTEEVNLNHALEAEGMKVVETDLGEYIVQLRNEQARRTSSLLPCICAAMMLANSSTKNLASPTRKIFPRLRTPLAKSCVTFSSPPMLASVA